MNLHEQVAQAIAKRRAVAQAASGDRNGTTPTGEHWYWGCPQHRGGIEVPITDVVLLDDLVTCPHPDCDGGSLGWLSSRETYPRSWSDRPMSHIALQVEELEPAVALHIQLNDPAFVIRQCERDIKTLNRHQSLTFRDGSTGCMLEWANGDGWKTGGWCQDILDLAESYEIEVPK